MAQAPGMPAGTGRVWLHFSALIQADVAVALCDAILDRNADLDIVASTRATDLDLQGLATPVTLPKPGRAAVAEFLNLHRPDAVGWNDGALEPLILRELNHRSIPAYLFDAGDAIEASRVSLPDRIFRSSPLRLFSSIVVGDAPTRAALLRAGAREAQVGIRGILENAPEPLPCNPAQRDDIAARIIARPIWMAAGVNVEELDPLLAATRQMLRRSHRQLLILQPAQIDQADHFMKRVGEFGLAACRRSAGEMPDGDVQVVLADDPDEDGLWYSLATVTFIGRTLAGPTVGMTDPFSPATMGSVILHGPATQPHYSNFTRLARARASATIAHAGELPWALDTLLAPDTAATKAQAAWEICTSGSDAIAYAADVLVGAVARGRTQ